MVAGGTRRHPRGMSEHTLHTPIVKRLERSQSDKWLAGVSGGLGRYFDITPTVFRLGFVVLTLLGGAGILVYIAAVLVMPKEGEESSIAEDILKKRRDHPARLVALGLVAVAILSILANADTWPSAGTAWFLVIVAGIILLWTSRRRGLAVALMSILAWFDVSLGDGVGNHNYAPAQVSTVAGGYHLGVGKLDLDLTRLPARTPANVKANVGIGDLRITIPRTASATIAAHVKAGSIDALGRHEDGTNVRLVTGGGSRLKIDADVGAGHI